MKKHKHPVKHTIKPQDRPVMPSRVKMAISAGTTFNPPCIINGIKTSAVYMDLELAVVEFPPGEAEVVIETGRPAEDLKVSELRAALAHKGMGKSGRKADLVARITGAQRGD